MRKFKVGDQIIYQKGKTSRHPGVRARNIHPAGQGEDYAYIVDKFWVVSRIIDDHTIEAKTRRGKRHRLHTSDRRLKPAGLFARTRYRDRFPTP